MPCCVLRQGQAQAWPGRQRRGALRLRKVGILISPTFIFDISHVQWKTLGKAAFAAPGVLEKTLGHFSAGGTRKTLRASPHLYKVPSLSTAVGSHSAAPKRANFAKNAAVEMDPRICEVKLSVIEQCLGGADMTDADFKSIKGFGNLAAPNKSRTQRTSESRFYKVICRAGQSIAALASRKTGKPPFAVRTTAFVPETSDNNITVDIGIFAGHAAAISAYSYTSSRRSPYYARCAWPWMLSCMEVKYPGKPSGFWFPPGDVDAYEDGHLFAEGDQNAKVLAQFVAYATEIMLRQHRTHLFAFYVSGPWVRAFRFDRSGCLVSKPFHVVKSPRIFPNLLYRLFCASPKEQGFDDTVKLATDADKNELKSFDTKLMLLKQHKSSLLNEQHLYPLYKVQCPSVSVVQDASPAEPPKSLTFLIGKPVACHYSATGRCTRGYIAYDIVNKRLVFFKDQWRALSRQRTELETYRHLHAHGVQHIATPIAGCDIEPQRTISHRYMPKLPERVHTRLVTKEVGRLLEEYSDAAELLHATSFAVVAHKQAWEKAGVLHHDISIGNVMIDNANKTGFLNDWDLARFADDMLNTASEPVGISGTWPFKSALSLRYPLKPPEVADDMESFVYLVWYMAVRFHRHAHSPSTDLRDLTPDQQRVVIAKECTALARAVNQFFYEQEFRAGFLMGGYTKLGFAQAGHPPFPLLENVDPPCEELAMFLSKAWILLKSHYSAIDFGTLKQYDPLHLDTQKPKSDVPAKVGSNISEHKPRNRYNLDHLLGSLSEFTPPATSSLPPPTKSAYPGPLSTHDALLQLIAITLTDPDTLAALESEVKYVDQFNGLSDITATETKNTSGKSRNPGGTSALSSALAREAEQRVLSPADNSSETDTAVSAEDNAEMDVYASLPSERPPSQASPAPHSLLNAGAKRRRKSRTTPPPRARPTKGDTDTQAPPRGKRAPARSQKVRVSRSEVAETSLRRSARLAMKC